MGRARDSVKAIARALGVYAWVKASKERGYQALRDWDWIIGLGIRKLLTDDGNRIRRFSKDFDNLELLERIETEILAEGKLDDNYRPGVSSPLNLRALYILCRVLEPDVVVETGVASGASSLIILNALESVGRGRLYSIDLPPTAWASQLTGYRELDRVSLPRNKTPGWLVPASLRHRWELILGDSQTELPRLLLKIGCVNLFYHDAQHTREAMLSEYRMIWPCLAPGGVLTSDDVGWNSAFDEFATEKHAEGTSKRWFGFGMIRKKR